MIEKKCGNANQLKKDSNNKRKRKMEDFEEKTEVREVVRGEKAKGRKSKAKSPGRFSENLR